MRITNTKLNFILGQCVWAEIKAKPLCESSLVNLPAHRVLRAGRLVPVGLTF